MHSKYKFFLIVLLLCLTTVASAARWRIMMVGNSITDGYPYEPGFRDDLYNQLTNAGVDFEFVGPDGQAPLNGLFLSGAKIEHFMQGSPRDIGVAIANYQPNMVLIHLGTNNYNDQAAPYSTDGGNTLLDYTSSGKLAQVLKRASNYSSIERMLVCKITSHQSSGSLDNPQVKLFNGEIDNLFFDRPAGIAVDKMTLVDMYSKLILSDYYDNLHPNDSGYAKMAAEYARVIKGINAGDFTKPGKISWVRGEVLDSQTGAIQLQWKAPGDDNYSGQANLYELRYSEFQLANFNDGILVPSIDGPGTANSTESLIMTGLIPGITYRFYIRAWDEHNNKGDVSDVLNLYIEPNIVPEYKDDFEDPVLSESWWDLDDWYAVQSGQLFNNNPAGGWSDLATYKAATYSPNSDYVENSIKFMQAGDLGLAMMLDDSTSQANGYFIFIRSNRLRLYAITNGRIQTGEITSVSTSASPQAGDEMVVQAYPNSNNGHSFEVSLNTISSGTVYAGSVNDPNKTQGNAEKLYSGVMMYGGNSYAIDDFNLKIPPLPAYQMDIYSGDNETGRVTKKLAQSLTVQILDVNGLPVSNVPVDFAVTDGVGYLSTHGDSIEQEFNNNLWIEAEDAALQLPMATKNDLEASNNKYVVVTPAVDNQGVGNNGLGSAEFQIYIPVAGIYRVWLRVLAPTGVSNSCYVSANGSDEYRWDFESRTYWQWAATGEPNRFTLPAGFVNFTIRNRESGTQIDKILLTRNHAYTPTGEGETTQPFSFITNASGLARTELTFGTEAGPVIVSANANVTVGNHQEFTTHAQALDPEVIAYNSPPSYPGVAGNPLDSDFSVFLQDIYGNACTGIAVEFKVISGDGSFNGTGTDSTRVSTDIDGTADIQLTLGYSEETVVQASLPDFPDLSPIEFRGIAGEGIPVIISATSGQNQTGTVMQALTQPLAVKVLDEKNEPVANYPVPFTVTKGNGTLNGETGGVTIQTGANGEASVTYTLGETAGSNSNEVTVDVNLPGAPIMFQPIAQADVPYRLTKLAGNEQETTAGKRFADSLKIKISDQYNNGIANYSVNISVISGDGNFNGTEGISVSNDAKILATNAQGIATTAFAAGNTVGETQIRVTGQSGLAEGSPDTFTLTVLPRVPDRITKVSGDTPVQNGIVNNLLGAPFKVKITDPFGLNMGAGVRVVMKSLSGGKFSSQDSVILQTGSDGTAQSTLRLGTVAGTQSAVAYLLDFPNVAPVQFTAAALPAPAAKMSIASVSPFTYKAGYTPVELQIKVTDEYENPYGGHPVRFQITQGNGAFPGNNNPLTVYTNSQGIAIADYKMGTDTQMTNLIQATATKSGTQTALTGSPLTLRGFVIPDTSAQIVKISGDSPVQQAVIGSLLPDPFTIKVRDQYGNPVSGEAVIFQVMNDDGRIGSETEVTQFTDANGQAQIFYTLGFTAGNNSDAVRVRVENRSDIAPVTFNASASASTPEHIKAWQDSLWNNLTLAANPLTLVPKARVTDIRNNPVPGVSVTFTVMQGGGSVNNAESITVQTGANGLAQVNWKLNAEPDTNIIKASASYNQSALSNSPVTFTAITRPGVPYLLKRVSAQNDTGVANQRLSLPLKVQVTDANHHPISGQPVSFDITFPAQAPKGKFILEDDSKADMVTINTDDNGYAQIYFQPVFGINTARAHSEYNGNTLQTNQVYYITGTAPQAKEVRLLSEKSDTRTVGDSLSIQVGAYDIDGYPVEKHTINYRVVQGNGHMASTGIDKSFASTLNGVATERWMLGTKIGVVNMLEISSTDGENHLAGSPDTVRVTLNAGAPFPDSTIITATDNVQANGSSSSLVTVYVLDRFDNPVAGRAVKVTSANEGVSIEGPVSATDATGKVTSRVRSTVADTVTINVALTGTPDIPLGSKDIIFTPGSAALITAVSGNQQIANHGAVLKHPFTVQVTDLYSNPVANVDVEFATGIGNGFHAASGLNSFTIKSDSLGFASALWVAGPNTGEQTVNAIIKNLGQASPVAELAITARNAVAPLSIKNVTMQDITGTAGVSMSEPLKACVLDKDTLAVYGQNVTFSTQVSGAAFVGNNPAASNYRGNASITLQPGNSAGIQSVRATITGTTTSVLIAVNVSSDSVKSLSVVSSSVVTDTVGKVIDDTLKVMARDKHNNPVSNVPVLFTVADAPGEAHGADFMNPDTVHTDVNGIAKGIFKMGVNAGEYIVAAESPTLETDALFTLQAVHGVPAKLAMVAGNNQVMTKNRYLVYPNVVKLTDTYGNIVPNETVFFQPKNFIGSVSSTRDTTDSLGHASCFWQLGDQTENTLWVSKPGTQPNYVEFSATGVDNAFPEFTNLPHTVEVDYTQGEFQYQVQAADNDGDAITYQIQKLPNYAMFDSQTGVLTWAPKANQKRTWNVVFEAFDNKPGNVRGFDVDSLTVVVGGNSAPNIISTFPPDPQLDVALGQSVKFIVIVDDADGDPLTITWYLDNVQVATGLEYMFIAHDHQGSHTLRCVVSDGTDSTEMIWSRVTKVELHSFSAAFEPYQGVQVDWETSSEDNNLGFFVYRSHTRDGEYVQLNDKLVPPTRDGHYSYIDTSAAQGRTWFYKLVDISASGWSGEHGPVQMTSSLPTEFKIHQNFPNPFNPTTRIRFELPGALQTKVIVYNIMGQQVKTLVNNKMDPGYHEIVWNGTNEQGIKVSSGVYYYRIIAGEYKEVKKMAFIK